MPVIGFLRSSTARGSAHLVAAFLKGLKEGGYVDGRNVTIDYRWADDQTDRLPKLAAELVHRPVDVLFAGASGASLAAKAATSKIPIVFVSATDPVKVGLVATLNRPGGNATGVTYLTSVLGGKRLELLHALVPAAKSVAVLGNLKNPTTGPLLRDIQSGGQTLGLQILVSDIASERDLEGTFATIAQQRPGALIVGPDPLFHRADGSDRGAGRTLRIARDLYDARILPGRWIDGLGTQPDRAVPARPALTRQKSSRGTSPPSCRCCNRQNTNSCLI